MPARRNPETDPGPDLFVWVSERAPFKLAGYVKDVFHDDNYLSTSVDVGVFWFGAVAAGRTWGIKLTHEF